ncbi:hypothetical protein BD410DRAFT_789426 [Rickenella mellea]|uniref:Uncharacterized protein n=1 Tax=Rickenella mellea TaxID=50990 RepID=A0A4Y7Q212_9AGAM|nr:hypothetical protein BD410DRAFT_789426 [Rickenella mellea]
MSAVTPPQNQRKILSLNEEHLQLLTGIASFIGVPVELENVSDTLTKLDGAVALQEKRLAEAIQIRQACHRTYEALHHSFKAFMSRLKSDPQTQKTLQSHHAEHMRALRHEHVAATLFDDLKSRRTDCIRKKTACEEDIEKCKEMKTRLKAIYETVFEVEKGPFCSYTPKCYPEEYKVRKALAKAKGDLHEDMSLLKREENAYDFLRHAERVCQDSLAKYENAIRPDSLQKPRDLVKEGDRLLGKARCLLKSAKDAQRLIDCDGLLKLVPCRTCTTMTNRCEEERKFRESVVPLVENIPQLVRSIQTEASWCHHRICQYRRDVEFTERLVEAHEERLADVRRSIFEHAMNSARYRVRQNETDTTNQSAEHLPPYELIESQSQS